MSHHRTVLLRMLELVGKMEKGQITAREREDLFFCGRWLVQREWRTGLLEMQSFMAYQTEDAKWQHEICNALEKLDA